MDNKIISEVDSLKTRVMLLEKLVLSLIEENDLRSKGLLTDKQKNTSKVNENEYLDLFHPRRRII